MKKPKLDDYELFYMEIPQTDYLEQLEKSTEDESEFPEYNKKPTMSVLQVKNLALDQLGMVKPQAVEIPNDQVSLFSRPATVRSTPKK